MQYKKLFTEVGLRIKISLEKSLFFVEISFVVFRRSLFVNITIEFIFAGINMFWARLRLILARAARLWRALRK